MPDVPQPPQDRLDRIEIALERLTERQQAFAESVNRLTERQQALAESMELMQHQWEARWERIATVLAQDAENIRALARVAKIHERRISHLEGETE